MEQISAHLKTRGMLKTEHRLGEPIEVYLHRRYLTEGAGTQAIADELGVNVGTVSRWLAVVGIEARLTGQRGTPVEAVA